MQESLAYIANQPSGVVVIVGQEQNQQASLAEITHYPGVPPENASASETGAYRVIGTGSQILRDLGVRKMRLLSSPTRFNAISGFDLEVVEFLENE